jgi:hypothetical protein
VTELSPGLHARVTLDEDGFGRVVNQVASNGVTVDVLDPTRRGFVGRVTATGPSSMTIELRAGGGSVFAANFAPQSVTRVAVRTFSQKRTIGAVAAGVVLFAAAWRGTVGGTTSPGAPPEPEQLVAPVTSGLRIAIADVVEALARLGSSR